MGMQHRRVLVADDNRSNQLIFGHLLRKAGFETAVVSSGDAVLDQLSAKDDFDALLIDLCMPELSGTEAIKLIRFQEACVNELGRLPVVAISADDGPTARQACLMAGADAFLTHPISSDTLVKTIESLINARTNIPQPSVNNVVRLQDRIEYRPASNRNFNFSTLEDIFASAGAEGVRDFIAAVGADIEVGINYMEGAIPSYDLDGFNAAMMSILSSTANLDAGGIKSVHHYARRLNIGVLGSVGPIIIVRLKYEAEMISAALAQFLAEKLAEAGTSDS